MTHFVPPNLSSLSSTLWMGVEGGGGGGVVEGGVGEDFLLTTYKKNG